MGWLNEDEKRLMEAFSKVDVTQNRYLSDFLVVCDAIINRDYSNRQFVLSKTAQVKQYCQKYVTRAVDKDEMYRLENAYWDILKMEAQNRQLDSYLLFLEKDRNPKEKFYQPKRQQFLENGFIQGYQAIVDDLLDILCISMPPSTGKTTLEKFFNSAVIGWFPDKYNLFFSHSSDITRMYYDGVLNIVSDSEYAWREVFPNLKISQTNAKSQKFNVGKYKAYPSVQCASIGAEMAGKVRCNGIAFCDDLIGKQEEALNEAYLQKLWENTYATDVSQRMEDGCKEVHTATRWANRDVIGRLIELNEGNPRFRWINVPDINPKTGKSNFMYAVNGFSVEFYNKQAKKMDTATYNALYKGEPMDRTGALYTEEELRRYSSLPDTEPDAILGICDTKEKGIDYTFLPVCYQYGMDFYCVDCICDDNPDYGVQYKQMVDIILEHNMQQLEFEANVGGNRIGYEVNERIEAAGGRCNITTKYTESNKETKIIINADWIKKHVLFKDKENYAYDSHYGRMMRFLLKYTTKGKNKNDDVPDGWANFALFVTNKVGRKATRILRSPI